MQPSATPTPKDAQTTSHPESSSHPTHPRATSLSPPNKSIYCSPLPQTTTAPTNAASCTPLLHLLADTGCRITEAISLTRGPTGLDLQADPPLARINRDSTRTDAGTRSVPLGASCASALRRHYLATGRPVDGNPVFRDQHGHRVRRNGRTSEGIKRVAAVAGLEGVTAHTLRHTHITWLVAAGVPDPIEAQRVGQTRLLTGTYAHPGAREDPAALAAIEEYRTRL